MLNIVESQIDRHLPVAVDEKEAARLIGISERTLADLRRDNGGKAPPHKMIGNRIVYGVETLKKWVNEQ